jgi:hypothetical protein
MTYSLFNLHTVKKIELEIFLSIRDLTASGE